MQGPLAPSKTLALLDLSRTLVGRETPQEAREHWLREHAPNLSPKAAAAAAAGRFQMFLGIGA